MIAIHPALFSRPNWQETIANIERATGLQAVTGKRYATLQHSSATAQHGSYA